MDVPQSKKVYSPLFGRRSNRSGNESVNSALTSSESPPSSPSANSEKSPSHGRRSHRRTHVDVAGHATSPLILMRQLPANKNGAGQQVAEDGIALPQTP